ncbi:MAG: replication initiation protein, partial [Alphaproteobacteria bacterium]|nr:replication initiation protein [Alphaproteobacteria bacterium]
RHAFGPDLASENRRFEIAVADLRETHESNDRLVQSIEALMTTVVTIQRPDGSTDRVQLLGWNNLSDPKRKRGNLKYSIPPELALLLKDSTVFAKLELEVLRAFTSKYALALYEAVARRVRLKHVFTERFALDDFRELLGVEPDKLTTYGNLNQFAIKPALLEVNALSDFTVTVVPEKTGRRVTGVLIGWGAKDIEGRKAAYGASKPGNCLPEQTRRPGGQKGRNFKGWPFRRSGPGKRLGPAQRRSLVVCFPR